MVTRYLRGTKSVVFFVNLRNVEPFCPEAGLAAGHGHYRSFQWYRPEYGTPCCIKRGKELVLAARSRQALQQLVHELTEAGAQAVEVVADVSYQEDVEHIGEVALEVFGALTPGSTMRVQVSTVFWKN